MITYNPKDWFKLIVHFHKSDTFRILFPTMILLGSLTALACYLEQQYIVEKLQSLTIFHQISGFIISLVLVFRINTAYDRWWEGRKLWGALINHSRSLAIRLHAIIPEEDINSRVQAHELISNFPFALKEHLRNNSTKEDLKFNAAFDEQTFSRYGHKPNLIVRQLTVFCLDICKKSPNTGSDYI